MATPNNNNLQDSGLYTYGTYDSANKTLNITSTNFQIAGATGLASGTFSSVNPTKTVTYTNGLITGVA